MASSGLTRSVLVTTVASEQEDIVSWQNKPFRLHLGMNTYRLSYEELNKIMTDADGEIRDYLADGDEHAQENTV